MTPLELEGHKMKGKQETQRTQRKQRTTREELERVAVLLQEPCAQGCGELGRCYRCTRRARLGRMVAKLALDVVVSSSDAPSRGAGATRRETRSPPDGEEVFLCDREGCGHASEQHEDFGRCDVTGCLCSSYVPEGV